MSTNKPRKTAGAASAPANANLFAALRAAFDEQGRAAA